MYYFFLLCFNWYQITHFLFGLCLFNLYLFIFDYQSYYIPLSYHFNFTYLNNYQFVFSGHEIFIISKYLFILNSMRSFCLFQVQLFNFFSQVQSTIIYFKHFFDFHHYSHSIFQLSIRSNFFFLNFKQLTEDYCKMQHKIYFMNQV